MQSHQIRVKIDRKMLTIEYYVSDESEEPYSTELFRFSTVQELFATYIQVMKKAYVKLFLPHIIKIMSIDHED